MSCRGVQRPSLRAKWLRSIVLWLYPNINRVKLTFPTVFSLSFFFAFLFLISFLPPPFSFAVIACNTQFWINKHGVVNFFHQCLLENNSQLSIWSIFGPVPITIFLFYQSEVTYILCIHTVAVFFLFPSRLLIQETINRI